MPAAKVTSKSKKGAFNLNSQTVVVIVISLLVGALGALLVTKSHAQVISGTLTNCGSSYGSSDYAIPTVSNLKYSGGLKNSDSVRNLAKFTCEKGKLSQSTALSINKSGNWSNALSSAIKAFELSDKRLAATADGKVDAKMVCALGENSYYDSYTNSTQFFYGLTPVGFVQNDCYTLLNTPRPTGK